MDSKNVGVNWRQPVAEARQGSSANKGPHRKGLAPTKVQRQEEYGANERLAPTKGPPPRRVRRHEGPAPTKAKKGLAARKTWGKAAMYFRRLSPV